MQQSSLKIALVLPYFGEWPNYGDYFFHSIAAQPFDLICFSNRPIPDKNIPNLIHKYCTFDEFKNIIQDKLGITVHMHTPYKLCDFKPTYGCVLSEALKGYDYWGSVDPDIIMGNFQQFINAETLNEIDVYSGINTYLSGSFFLMRNSTYCNTLFKRSKDWEHVLTSEHYMGFDECGGHYFEQLNKGISIFSLNTPIQSMTEVLLLEAKQNNVSVLWSNDILEPKQGDKVQVQEKQIIFQDKFFLLMHLIYFKTRFYFYLPKQQPASIFYLTGLGYFSKFPAWYCMLFSRNLWLAIRKKIEINIKKIIPC